MNRIVDVKHNTFFTEDHLELHCKFVNKDKDTCREPHLYGSEQPLGLAYVETKLLKYCLLYTSPSPRDRQKSRMPSSA